MAVGMPIALPLCVQGIGCLNMSTRLIQPSRVVRGLVGGPEAPDTRHVDPHMMNRMIVGDRWHWLHLMCFNPLL